MGNTISIPSIVMEEQSNKTITEVSTKTNAEKQEKTQSEIKNPPLKKTNNFPEIFLSV
jgi:hypothetical protein